MVKGLRQVVHWRCRLMPPSGASLVLYFNLISSVCAFWSFCVKTDRNDHWQHSRDFGVACEFTSHDLLLWNVPKPSLCFVCNGLSKTSPVLQHEARVVIAWRGYLGRFGSVRIFPPHCCWVSRHVVISRIMMGILMIDSALPMGTCCWKTYAVSLQLETTAICCIT